MGKKNRHQLTRDIPESVKRQVRQRDGFGCIICGVGIYEYDHFNPEFSEARFHDPNGIISLCARCHTMKEKGLLARVTIENRIQNPRCQEQGFSREVFDVGSNHPTIILGKTTFFNVRCLLKVHGEDLFSILPPDSSADFFRINAKMSDTLGKVFFEIHENEWRVRSENWDAEQTANRIIIRKGPGDIVLALRSEPPNILIVEQLHMQWRSAMIDVTEGASPIARVKSRAAGFDTTETTITGADVAIEIR